MKHQKTVLLLILVLMMALLSTTALAVDESEVGLFLDLPKNLIQSRVPESCGDSGLSGH